MANTAVEVLWTSKPWDFGLDAIVVSSGFTLGNLGKVVQAQFPNARWRSVNFAKLKPNNPIVLALASAGQQQKPPHWVIVAGARESTANPMVFNAAVGVATKAAIMAAARIGASSVAVPLLGTGALGASLEKIATVAVPAVVSALREVPSGTFSRIVFIAANRLVVPAVRAAWTPGEAGEAARPEVSSWESPTAPEPPDVGLAGGISRDLVDPNGTIPMEKDRLGVAPYVSMLATVLADRRTPLPLSIGIFGEWGSGKSYFMGLLRSRVTQLANSGDEHYLREVVQIGFNAWHYADQDLWACLGDHIFRHLAGPEATGHERREHIRAELGAKLDQQRQLDTATQRASDSVARLRATVDAAHKNREHAARDLITAMRGSEELKTRLDSVWNRLGVTDGVTDGVEKAKLLAEDMRGTLSDVDAIRRSPREYRGKLALVAALVVLGVAGVAVLAFPSLQTWLAGIGGLSAIAAAVLGST